MLPKPNRRHPGSDSNPDCYSKLGGRRLQQEFEAAVDDYLQTCVRVGKEPQRPFKGLFNVRVPAQLHRSAALRATRDGVSLNEVVVSALTSYLQS